MITQGIFLFTVKPEEVSNAIKTSKNKNCNSITHVPAQELKIISKLICNSLNRIINIYILKGIFPQSFEKATVTPIHKSGDTSLVHNFRPISKLPDISKKSERALHNKFFSYLTKNKLLHVDQYGFRENGSTTDALLNQTEYLFDSISQF